MSAHAWYDNEQGDSATLGAAERAASAAAGTLLLASGLRPRLIRDLALVGASGYLLYRAATGVCPVRERLLARLSSENAGSSEFSELVPRAPSDQLDRVRRDRRKFDSVDEAVLESFPASDPPASTQATAAPSAPQG